MGIWRPTVAFFLVALFLVLGCAGIYKRPAIDVRTVTWQSIPNILSQNLDRLSTLKGRARILVEMPGFQYQAYSKVVIKRPDSLFVKIEAALGIDVGWFFSDRQTFAVYLPFQNTYYSGLVDSVAIPNPIQFDLSYDQMLEALIGIEVPSDLDSGSQYRQDNLS